MGAALFYIPANSAQGSQCLHILAKTYFVVLDCRHESEVITHKCPELHFPLRFSHAEHLLKHIQTTIVIKKKEAFHIVIRNTKRCY